LKTKSIERPRNLSWKEKRNMMGQEILSKSFLRKPSCNRGLPIGDAYSWSRGPAPFKVQIKFNIPIVEGHIDTYVVEKWLNIIEGYLSIHNFLNREKITFSLLKVIPHVKDWWEMFCEQKEIEEPSLFIVTATWECFRDTIKEQYYLVRSYDELYTKWTTLRKERDQAVTEFTNIFHSLRTKLGINDSKRNMVLKYHSALHRYIKTKMEFLDISSLGASYQYAIKIDQKLKKNTWQFEPGNPSEEKLGRGSSNSQNKGHIKYEKYQDNLYKP
jgi:hypothetical protein